MAEYFLDGSVTQPYWDQAVEPRLVIDPGDRVVFDCPEPTGQLTPQWSTDDLENFDFSLVHALVGSVFIRGAQPGDVLELSLIHISEPTRQLASSRMPSSA